ncbi:MAG: hypothetical protein ACPGNV_11580 [Mangrovicoccus sp.]
MTAQESTSEKSESSTFNKDDVLAALNRAQVIIEFDLDGTILDANEQFLKTFGYGFDDICAVITEFSAIRN